jgi:hypothetical protein
MNKPFLLSFFDQVQNFLLQEGTEESRPHHLKEVAHPEIHKQKVWSINF